MNSLAKEKALKNYEGLIKLGRDVLATRRAPALNHITTDFIDVQLANQWFTSSLSLIAHTIGEQSEHYFAMKRQFVTYPKWHNAEQAFGVLLAAKQDIENDALSSVVNLTTAEVFDNFLEQAEALIKAGYYAPAAVVIGCVLEDMLRKLCDRHAVEIKSNERLDSMNAALAKSDIYNRLTQKKITALADIRNSAAHGKWEEFTANDVEDMNRWTVTFLEQHIED